MKLVRKFIANLSVANLENARGQTRAQIYSLFLRMGLSHAQIFGKLDFSQATDFVDGEPSPQFLKKLVIVII